MARRLCPFGQKLIIAGLVLCIAALACGCAGPGQTRGSRSRWFEGVSEADRAKLHQLREMVKDDPAVRAASEKRKRADVRISRSPACCDPQARSLTCARFG